MCHLPIRDLDAFFGSLDVLPSMRINLLLIAAEQTCWASLAFVFGESLPSVSGYFVRIVQHVSLLIQNTESSPPISSIAVRSSRLYIDSSHVINDSINLVLLTSHSRREVRPKKRHSSRFLSKFCVIGLVPQLDECATISSSQWVTCARWDFYMWVASCYHDRTRRATRILIGLLRMSE